MKLLLAEVEDVLSGEKIMTVLDRIMWRKALIDYKLERKALAWRSNRKHPSPNSFRSQPAEA